ncbi:Mor transcription activator family protein [Chrysiogenes arsenatis]|uniref:Mor transcription activator family protein n=1 Tax=Chrysiogenes arsenatis TaxID=309797 RepID=UPI0003F6B20C|nr:Mor transcription activator family protein [Chrysiogenes arsenatis]
MNDVEKDFYPELFRDLADKAAQLLVSEGLAPELADDLGYKFAELLRMDWSGEQFYLPKGVRFELHKRDLEMFKRFNGRNYSELSRLYGISTRQVRKRINDVRVALLAKQPSLFDAPSASEVG